MIKARTIDSNAAEICVRKEVLIIVLLAGKLAVFSVLFADLCGQELAASERTRPVILKAFDVRTPPAKNFRCWGNGVS